jgi:hypothetical protein
VELTAAANDEIHRCRFQRENQIFTAIISATDHDVKSTASNAEDCLIIAVESRKICLEKDFSEKIEISQPKRPDDGE